MNNKARGALLALALLGAASIHAQDARWQGRLSTVPIDSSMASSVTGHGDAAAELAGSVLDVSGTFTGLAGPATTAQLREGQYVGVRGPAIADLTVTRATEGSVSGQVELTPAQVEALRAGRLYVQIHSEAAPEGNLWGWLLSGPPSLNQARR